MGFLETIAHLFTPRHTNNHRAKLLHIDALSICLLLFVIINITFKQIHIAAPGILGYATNIYVDQLLTETNAKRESLGLPLLTLNNQLSDAAMLKAQNMFSENYWAHNSPSGKSPWSFITKSGYRYTVAGENLAKNFMSSQGVVDAWMASPSHKDNMVKPQYREVGFAVVNGILQGEETTLVVQMFGARTDVVVQRKTEPIALGRSDSITPSVMPTAIPTPLIAAAHVSENGVTIRPLFNLHTISKYLSYSFFSLMIVVALLDWVIASRKRVVRASGHNIAHTLFFIVMLIMSVISTTGTIL